MSTSLIRKFVLAAALAVMPMQGIAAALSVLLCHGDAQAHAMHTATSHDHDGQQHQHEHGAAGNDQGNGAGASYFHLCCNLTAFAPPSITLAVELPDFPIRAFAPDSLHDLYVPDQPQRPPLA